MTRGLENTHLLDVQIYLKEHAKDWAIQHVRDALREWEQLIYSNVHGSNARFQKNPVNMRVWDFKTEFLYQIYTKI